VTSTDDHIGCNTVAASFALTLPAANSVANGKKVIIKDEGGAATTHPLAYAPNGTDKIDGVNATQFLNVNFAVDYNRLQWGRRWFII
jgi:hypothetical protein